MILYGIENIIWKLMPWSDMKIGLLKKIYSYFREDAQNELDCDYSEFIATFLISKTAFIRQNNERVVGKSNWENKNLYTKTGGISP